MTLSVSPSSAVHGLPQQFDIDLFAGDAGLASKTDSISFNDLKDKKPKNILLGITAGIAAYKMYDLVNILKKLGHNVTVVLTKDAESFVAKLPLKILSGNEVYTENDFFSDRSQIRPIHIDLADNSDVVIIAPATADFIGRIANGLCDKLLNNILLVTRKPVYLVPAMNTNMWEYPMVQENVEKIESKLGYKILRPKDGELACGYSGTGHIVSNDEIIRTVLGEVKNSEKESPLSNLNIASKQRFLMNGKIHRATVTEANLNYVGSMTIDSHLMELADIVENERIDVLDITNGNRITTYAIPGEEDSGIICANGACSHQIKVGDKVIIVSYAQISEKDIKKHNPQIVHVDENNKLIS